MDSQGATWGQKSWVAKIGPGPWCCKIWCFFVPFLYQFVHFLIPVKFKSPVLDLSKILHKAQCLLCLTITPFKAARSIRMLPCRCQGYVWSLSLGMAWWKPCTQLGSLDNLVDIHGYQMEPCAKGSSSRYMDMLSRSSFTQTRKTNQFEWLGWNVESFCQWEILKKLSQEIHWMIECWSFINPQQASQRLLGRVWEPNWKCLRNPSLRSRVREIWSWGGGKHGRVFGFCLSFPVYLL